MQLHGLRSMITQLMQPGENGLEAATHGDDDRFS